jgi:hypothetical protein
MENFKNIITLLNNPETLELGTTLAVSQGLGEKIITFYKLKRSRQNYKKRDLFFSKKNELSNCMFCNSKVCKKRNKQYKFSEIRNFYSEIIIQLNESIFISNSLND